MRYLVKLLLCIAITFSIQMGYAEAGAGKFSLDMGIGIEDLHYEETGDFGNIAGLAVDSEADVVNMILSARGEYDLGKPPIFIGIKTAFPLYKGDDTEEWVLSGIWNGLYQTNTLEYEWFRLDPYLGYRYNYGAEPLSGSVKPYAGVRCSWAEQKRSNFVILNTSYTGATSTEQIDSYGVLLGIQLDKNFTETFKLGGYFEGVIPFSVEVTNDNLPGWEADNKDGYTLEGGIISSFKLAKDFYLNIDGYLGLMHWDGTGWEAYSGGLVKWPENNTMYMGGTLSVSYEF